MNRASHTKQHRNASSPNKDVAMPRDAELLAPYKPMSTFNQLTEVHQKRLLKFLRFSHDRGIQTPTRQDFLDYSCDCKSSSMLRDLREVFDILFRGHPVTILELQVAISEKTRTYSAKYKPPCNKRKRKAAKYSTDVTNWPTNWQAVWFQLENGQRPSEKKAFAKSTLINMKDVIGRYVWILKDLGLPIEINVNNLSAFEKAKKDRAPADRDAAYKNEGKRAATFQTATQRLIQFGTELGVASSILDDFRIHERFLKKETDDEVSLKYARLECVPDYRAIYKVACYLLQDSFKAHLQRTRSKLRNQAAIIGLWMFMPLRLSDGQLRWGSDIDFCDNRYRINVTTNKTGKRIMARLHPKLNQFFDALIFEDLNNNLGPEWLNNRRQQLIEQQAPVFHNHLGIMLVKNRPSKVWREHFGTGAHIARTKAHTELGQKGEEGVKMALALCAQSDFKTRLYYQAEAVDAALTSTSQDMMNDMIEEAIYALSEE